MTTFVAYFVIILLTLAILSGLVVFILLKCKVIMLQYESIISEDVLKTYELPINDHIEAITKHGVYEKNLLNPQDKLLHPDFTTNVSDRTSTGSTTWSILKGISYLFTESYKQLVSPESLIPAPIRGIHTKILRIGDLNSGRQV